MCGIFQTAFKIVTGKGFINEGIIFIFNYFRIRSFRGTHKCKKNLPRKLDWK